MASSDSMEKARRPILEICAIPIIELSESSEEETECTENSHIKNIRDLEIKTETKSIDLNETVKTNGSENEAYSEKCEFQDTPDSNFNLNLFNELLQQCKKYFKFPQDEKIIEKMTKYFQEINVSYRYSAQCSSLLESLNVQVERRKGDIYVFVKEVLDEFKKCKTNLASNEDNDAAKSRRIKKLEKLLEMLDRKIKKVQEKEVDLNADNHSDYILECKLKEKFIKVYNLISELTGCDKNEASCPRKKINFNATRYPEINRDISKKFSKHPDFPDYTTMLNIIKRTNSKESLHLSEAVMNQLAKEAFVEVGEELKRRRQSDFVSNIGCHLTDVIDFDNNDPAATDDTLNSKLIENQQIGKRRLDEVLEKFSNMKEDNPEQDDEMNDSADNDNTDTDGSESMESDDAGDESDESDGTDETNESDGTDETNHQPDGTDETKHQPDGTDETKHQPDGTDETKHQPDGTDETSHQPVQVNSNILVSGKRSRESCTSPLDTLSIKLKEEPNAKKWCHTYEEDDDIIVLD